MSLTLPASFYQAAVALLGQLGIGLTATNINLLAAWSYCEKPHTGAAAWQWNNPWNTTQPGFGETGTANSAGVAVYPSRAFGIEASAATLSNGLYPQLLRALQTSNAGTFFAATSEMATWGTDMACIRQTYAALGTPPAQYLVAAVSVPGPSVHAYAIPGLGAVTTSPLTVFGGILLLGGLGIAAFEAGTHRARIREWFGRQLRRGTITSKGD